MNSMTHATTPAINCATPVANRTMPSSTVSGILQRGARSLIECSDSPRLDAELLLGRILGLSRARLIARGDDGVAIEHEHAFGRLLEQRRHGAPVAYLTGSREFWSLTLDVTPAVLVPRPETELLVELALGLIPPDQPRSVLDLGTGSGAIALALAAERPDAHITAVDISPAALDVARENSRRLGITNVEWRLGSWFEAVPDLRFDLILANPPYIAAADPALAALLAEPHIALCPGPTGLEALAAIAAGAPSYLTARGWLILEHGAGQAPQVSQLLERRGFRELRSQLDLAGKPRVTLGSFTLDTFSTHGTVNRHEEHT
jgi:release factor glutamine methyltransferase